MLGLSTPVGKIYYPPIFQLSKGVFLLFWWYTKCMKTKTTFAVGKLDGTGATPLKDEQGIEVWYDTRDEAQETLDKKKNPKQYTIIEKKENVQ